MSAIPDVQVHQRIPGKKFAHLHLTRNKDKALTAIMGGAGTPTDVSAINIKAAFAVTTQARLMTSRSGNSGSCNCQRPMWPSGCSPAVPANLANEFLLDSLPGVAPFMPSSTPTVLRRTSDIWMEMDDHPSSVVPLEMPNETAKETNFLVRVVKDFSAVTTMVAVDDKGKMQPLAHLTWDILWNVSFQWRGGICRPVMKQRQFSATASKRGAPADKAAARLVATPSTDSATFYNAVFEQAKGNILKIKASEHEVAMSESKEWVPGIAEGPVFP